MIESIHNNENNQGKKRATYETIRLPKNVRQIGQVEGNKQIYVEDYVMTYIKQLAMKSYGTYQVAVLLGEMEKSEQLDYIFVNGAVEVRDVLFEDDKVFDSETWTRIYEEIKMYFNELEVVGWYITRPGLDLELTERIRKIHIDNFAGSNKVLLMYDSMERDEVFYLYSKKNFLKQSGYYVYYERNEPMQTYMIDHKDKPSIEADFVDKASINIRSVLNRKTRGSIKNTAKSGSRSSAVQRSKSEVREERQAVFGPRVGTKPDTRAESREEIRDEHGEVEVIRRKGSSVTYAAASVAAIIILFGVGVYLSGQSGNGGNENANIPVAVEPAAPTAEPNKEATVIITKPGEFSTIKGEAVQGDATSPTTEVLATAPPVETTSAEVQATVAPTTAATEKPVSVVATKPETHKVVKGDTLGSISLQYYDSKQYIQQIMEANGITDSDKIYIGQELKLP